MRQECQQNFRDREANERLDQNGTAFGNELVVGTNIANGENELSIKCG
jgi:hypothetical protein